jgi:hypothetical protein
MRIRVKRLSLSGAFSQYQWTLYIGGHIRAWGLESTHDAANERAWEFLADNYTPAECGL